jgi:hypothetical protein
LQELKGRGLIRSLRGRIRIVDRLGLQLAASGFYGISEVRVRAFYWLRFRKNVSSGFISRLRLGRGLASHAKRQVTSSVPRPCEKQTLTRER